MTVRAARASDAAALAELQDEANGGHLRALAWNRPGRDWRRVGTAVIEDDTSEMSWQRSIVACDGERVVGMLNYADNTSIPPVSDPIGAPFVSLRHQLGPCLYLRAMAVLPSERGRGVGTMLLDIATGAARENGSRTMGVIVHEQTDGLLAHYRSRGFREIATERVVRHHSYPSGSKLLALRLELASV